MKKTNYIIIAAAAALAFSCTSVIERQDLEPQAGEHVTIRVFTTEVMDTKVSLTESGDKKAMNLAWENTDKLSINGNEFSVSNIISAHEAEFDGSAPAESPYTIIYPGKYATAVEFNARSYAAQTQTGNSSTAHLEYNAMLSGVTAYAEPKFDAAWATANGGSLVQNGAIQLRLQLPDGVATATSVSLVASRAVFPTTNAGGDLAKTQTLSLSSVTLPSNHILEAYMMFSAAGVTWQAGDKLTVAVGTPDGVYYRVLPDMTDQTWTGGNQYTIQCKVNTENNFVINNADDLEEFRDGVNSGNFLWQTCSVSLGADINCSGIASWTPIGNGTFEPVESGTVSATWTEPAFKGTFDGNNHAIKNLVMTESPATYTPYGLFGILYKATVKNLTLGAVSADTGALNATPIERMDAGALAGVAYGSTIQNVTNYFPMTIPSNSSPNRVAMGMVGYVYADAASGLSTLSGLNNYGAVNAIQSAANEENGAKGVHVAGIAGFSNTGAAGVINIITGCTNYAVIESSTGRSAGILGTANTRTTIDNCNNRGNVRNTYTKGRVGGITAILAGTCSMFQCHNYNKVEATGASSNVGGLVCILNSDTASVSESENEGSVEGVYQCVGGIAGYISAGTITLCVNTGNITGATYVGGIVGRHGTSNGWAYVNKCRSDAVITATSSSASCVGGIAGQMYGGGVLNTCSAKGTVVAAGYDAGGIVGQMYSNHATYGRMYVYDCLAAADVTCSRPSGNANVGGVVGRLTRNASYTGQYMALENCIGLNKKITSNLKVTGAFVGQVAAGSTTNASYVRVRNCISLVENSNYNVNTSADNTGGFTGSYLGVLTHCYYLVDNNKQTAASGTPGASNLTKSDLATLTGSDFCTAHSSRAGNYSLTVNSVQYKSTGWEIPAGCSYPVPKTLAALGEDYYK